LPTPAHRDDRRHTNDRAKDQRGEFQRDRDRILYSPFFRRLAGVTQVVHAGEGHVFHNRLTHTIKVAQIGRRLAELLRRDTDPDVVGAVGGVDEDVVETACLSHDLGHPPFGHIAESQLNACATEESVSDGFEGNPQSFRIVTAVAVRSKGHPGLNLTSASLNAILKYPWPRDTEGKRHQKWGHYHSELNDFDFARSRDGKGSDKRSVEAEIMDWADDVAYSLHDVDDFYKAGFVPLDRILSGGAEAERFVDALKKEGVITDPAHGIKFFEQLKKNTVDPDKDVLVPFEGTSGQYQALNKLEALLIRRYLGLDQPGTVKVDPDGEKRLFIDPTLRQEVDILKGLMRFYVYGHPALVAQQYGQQEVVKKLFEVLFDATQPDSRHARIIPPPFKETAEAVNCDQPDESGNTARVRLVMDIIASMTEQQAVAFHGRLVGIAPGSILDRIVRP
jgi:dGTPase